MLWVRVRVRVEGDKEGEEEAKEEEKKVAIVSYPARPSCHVSFPL